MILDTIRQYLLLIHYMPTSMMYTSVFVLFWVTECYSYRLWALPHCFVKKQNNSTEENISNLTNDVLPTSMPKLEVSGTNWEIYMLHFQTVVQGKELWGHFDGSILCPVLSPPVQFISIPISVPFDTATSVVTQQVIDIWNQNESVAHSLLTQ